MSTPTTTPRTDAECIQIYSDDVTGCSDARDYVDASFARTLETELADAKAEAAHYMSVAQKATDDLARLRAERADSASSVMWYLTAHQMACTAGLERDQLRAEVEAADKHCDILKKSNSRACAEVERLKTCGIAELAAVNSSVLEYCKHWEARAERAEAELKAERAIVSRIWTQLGSPTYEQLRGRSIYDLISELKANATSSAPRWKREREWQAGIIAHAQLHHAERKEAIARAERAEAEVARLRAGIGECLRQNGHLADGEDCTLISLKRCLYNPTDTRESKGVADRDPVQTQ